MAVEHKNGRIILTGSAGRSFSHKMKNQDASVIKKRDAFLKGKSDSCGTTHNCDGRIVVKTNK